MLVPIVTEFDAPTWALSCMICGGYRELDPGQPRPVAGTCFQCGSKPFVVGVFSTRGGSMTAVPNLGSSRFRAHTLGGVQDWQ